jgi:hypothetical protein
VNISNYLERRQYFISRDAFVKDKIYREFQYILLLIKIGWILTVVARPGGVGGVTTPQSSKISVFLLNKIGKFSFLLLNKIEKFSFFAQQNREIFFHMTPKIMLHPQKSANFGLLIKKMSLHPSYVD